jgi:peptide/nickel transport system substrate-binding protein
MRLNTFLARSASTQHAPGSRRVAPFYSVLLGVDPADPADTTRFVCDLCLTIPKPADDGKTYAFNIREGVKFQDGIPLTAAHVVASCHEIIFPRQMS